MQIMSVVGARPQFVKLAPMARAFAGRCDHVVVHTGQHYDAAMSDVFFDELEIPRPDEQLDIGSASHGAQTGRMLEAVEGVLHRRRPDAVLVYGDTNSTLAATLAAVKLGIPVAHLEAGLRSFDRPCPKSTTAS
jgi:UDP-N-acetylglucosamine 2-epimerase (non-hydrolysing)